MEKFYIVNKKNGDGCGYPNARSVAMFLFGKKVNDYIVAKGDRILTFTSVEITDIERVCEES